MKEIVTVPIVSYEMQFQNLPGERSREPLVSASNTLNHDPNDNLIALTINRKMKGWAWRHGHACFFGKYENSQALFNWASSQPFWNASASKNWGENVSWTAVYTDMCLELSEGKATNDNFAMLLQCMVADAIKQHNQNTVAK